MREVDVQTSGRGAESAPSAPAVPRASRVPPPTVLRVSRAVRRLSRLGRGERIETSLAKAVKQMSVRTMDVFKDWDTNSDGVISRKEFRNAMKALGAEGTEADHDALFDSWDADKSGALDFKELEKAFRKVS